jgi:hypothetical protein
MATTRARPARLDNQLMRALHDGPGALPDDLNRLQDYLRLIDALLAEKAQEHEPEWALALAASAEVETLLRLQGAVVEKAAEVRGRTLWAVLTKLAIWQKLDPCEDEESAPSLRDRLVLSVRRDIERIARSGTGRLVRIGPY